MIRQNDLVLTISWNIIFSITSRSLLTRPLSYTCKLFLGSKYVLINMIQKSNNLSVNEVALIFETEVSIILGEYCYIILFQQTIFFNFSVLTNQVKIIQRNCYNLYTTIPDYIYVKLYKI